MNHLAPVSTIMKEMKELFTVSPEDTLLTIKEIFAENKFHHVPVINKHKLVGIISKNDFLQALVDIAESGLKLSDDALRSLPVKEYMTTKMATVGLKERVDVAALIFKENIFHCLPIVNEEKELLGLITPFDILTHSFKLTQVY
jgi:acetoin utilization protein AcuB